MVKSTGSGNGDEVLAPTSLLPSAEEAMFKGMAVVRRTLDVRSAKSAAESDEEVVDVEARSEDGMLKI